MSTATPDQRRAAQIERIQAHFDRVGHEIAHRVMGQCIADFLPVATMQALVDAECNAVRDRLKAAGAAPAEIAVMVDGIRLAIIQEGRRIAEGLSTEGGTA